MMMNIDKKIIFAAAGVVFLAGLWVLLAPSPGVKPPPVSPQLNKAELMGLIEQKQENAASSEDRWGQRNPFVLDPSGGIKGFNLLGVFWGSPKPSAIINNTVLKVGDKIDTLTVKDIQDDKVIVEDADGRRRILSMRRDFLVTTPGVLTVREEVRSVKEIAPEPKEEEEAIEPPRRKLGPRPPQQPLPPKE